MKKNFMSQIRLSILFLILIGFSVLLLILVFNKRSLSTTYPVKTKTDNCYNSDYKIVCIKAPCVIQVCSGENQDLILAVVNDLAKKLQVNKDTIIFNDITETNWSNGSLGCPKPGEMYTQAVVLGYEINLTHGNKKYSYHTNRSNGFVTCDNPTN